MGILSEGAIALVREAMEVKYDIHSAARAVPSNPLFIQWCKRHMHYFNRF